MAGPWDEIFRTRESSEEDAPKRKRKLVASPASLRKLVPKKSALSSALDEGMALFRGAGTLGKSLGDLVLDPVGSLRGEDDGLKDTLKGWREGTLLDSPEKKAAANLGALALSTSPLGPLLYNANFKAPDFEKIGDAVNKLQDYSYVGLAKKFAKAGGDLLRGYDSDKTQFQNVAGSRAMQKLAEALAQADDIAALDKEPPLIQKALRKAPFPLNKLEQYVDPNVADVGDTAKEAGYGPWGQLFLSLANPLEYVGAEGSAARAAKLAKSGKLRKALNAAGSFLDPVQKLVDVGEDVAKINWKLPGKSAPRKFAEEEIVKLARQSGVSIEDARRLVEEMKPGRVEATPAKPSKPSAPLDTDLERIARDAGVDVADMPNAQAYAKGMVDDAAAAEARVAEEASPASPEMLDTLDRYIDPEGWIARKQADIPHGASQDLQPDNFWDEVFNAEKDYEVGKWGDKVAAKQAADIQADDVYDLQRQAMDAATADEQARALDASRRRDTQMADMTMGSKLADLTPSILPNDPIPPSVVQRGLPRIEPSLEESLMADMPGAAPRLAAGAGPVDPLRAMGEPSPAALDAVLRSSGDTVAGGPVLEQASQATLPGRIGGGEAGVLPGTRPGFAGAEALPDAGSPAVGMVDAAPTPRPAITEGVAAEAVGEAGRNGLVGGLKLNSNPFLNIFEWPRQLGNRGAVPKFLAGLEDGMVRALDSLRANPIFRRIDNARSRMFSVKPGEVDWNTYTAVNNFQMGKDAILKTAYESVYPILKGGTETERGILQQFMNGSIDARQAEALGLSQDKILRGQITRDLMDYVGASKIATSLGVEKELLTRTSIAEKELLRRFYESFNGRTAHIAPAGEVPMRLNRNNQLVRDESRVQSPAVRWDRQRIIEQARADGISQEFINNAQTTIDDAMRRLEQQGFLDQNGKIIDMGLDWGTWIKNLGKYEPRLYHMIEYGVDVHSPTAASDFLDAIEARHNSALDAVNAMQRERGLPEYPPYRLPMDVRTFVLSHYASGGTRWTADIAEAAGRFLRRQDLSQEMKDILGPLVDPAYSYAKGIQQVKMAEHVMQMRRFASTQDHLVSRPGETVEQFMERTGIHEADIAYDFASNPQYASQAGVLAGRFVHRDVADLMAWSGIIPHLNGKDALDQLKSTTRAWLAINKVIMNPASHFRQFFQNSLGLWISKGFRTLADFANAHREIRNKTPEYLEARSNGVFKAGHDSALYDRFDSNMPEFSFDGVESTLAKIARQTHYLAAMADKARKAYTGVKQAGKKTLNWAGDKFQVSDDWARYALYKHFKRQGHGPAEAARLASQEVYSGTPQTRWAKANAGLSYRDTFYDRGQGGLRGTVNNTIEGATGLLMNPFYGVGEFLVGQSYRGLFGVDTARFMPMTDPARAIRAWSVMGAAYAMNQMGRYWNDMTPEQEKKQKPLYMNPTAPNDFMAPPALTSMVAGDGTHMWVNFESILPWGSLTAGKYNVKSGKNSSPLQGMKRIFTPALAGSFSRFTGEGDDFGLNPALKPFFELMTGKDSFTGRDVYPMDAGATTGEKARAGFRHLFRSFAPPWMPNPVGLSEALPALRPASEYEWQDAVRMAFQGLARDSGTQASKLFAGAYNAYSDKHLAQASQRIREAAHITDYAHRYQSLGSALVDVFPVLGGGKLEMRLHNQVMRQLETSKKAEVANMKKNLENRIANLKGSDKRAELKRFRDTARLIMKGKPTLQHYESPADSFMNYMNALGNIMKNTVNFQFKSNRGDVIS